MKFDLGDGRVLQLGADAIAKMQAHRQITPDATEAGGVLLGRVLAAGHFIVDDVTEPIATDRRTRFTFHRSTDHQGLIDAAYAASDGACGWLGEWHTHAEPDPTPSATDLHDWRQRVRDDVYDGELLVFVIVGQEHVRAWSCDRAGNVAQIKGAT